jgi:antirestriction protein
MNEREPDQQPPQPGLPEPDTGPWDPAEQVGDVYAVEIGAHGQIEHAERLPGEQADAEPGRDEQAPENRPRIWVGSWLDYNNGVLHGDWIDVDREDTEIWADIQAMLARSPTAAETGEAAEDWGIFDHEHFGGLRIDEQETVTWVAKVARGISEHGPAYAAWAGVVEDEALLDGFERAYLGHYDSVQAYAEEHWGELGFEQLLERHVPEHLRLYVHLDTEALARDLQFGGRVYVLPADEGGVWLFAADQ